MDTVSGKSIFILFTFLVCAIVEDDAKGQITFTGAEEDVLAVGEWGLYHTPDGHVSFFPVHGTYHIWFTAGTETHHFVAADFDNPKPARTSGGTSVPVLGPRGSDFDRNYAGAGSVFHASNGRDLLMFYHAEDWQWGNSAGWPTGTYYASVGLARSTNGGLSWVREGQVITGRDPKPFSPTRFANGAGVPSVYVDQARGYMYIYYTDWPTNQGAATGADAIHLARAPIASDGMPGSWSKYYQGAFTESGLGGNSDAVISPANGNAAFAAFASVSFNIALGSYLAVFLSDDGFYESASPNGTQWSTPERFFEFPVPHSQLQTGNTWYIYPTLLSPGQCSDMTTGQAGYLYYAKGVFNQAQHHMVRRPTVISGMQTPDKTCEPSAVLRDVAAMMILRAKFGYSYNPGLASGVMFDDVGKDDFAAAWIELLKILLITEGCDNSNYCPKQVLTKLQAAKILLRAKYGGAFIPAVATGEVFDDVDKGDENADWIEQLASEGIAQGCGNNNFCPDEVLSVSGLANLLRGTFP